MLFTTGLMSSIDDETLLILETLKSFLLIDDLDDSWVDLLISTVTDVIEGDYIDLNVLMYCAMSISHFRMLLEEKLDKYENTHISASFTLVYLSFEDYVNDLSQRENKVALSALLNTKSLAKMLV